MKEKKYNKNLITKKVLISFLAIFLILICIGPVFFVFWNSAKTIEEYASSLFKPPENFKNFIEHTKYLIKDAGILKNILNSFVVTIMAIFLNIVLAATCGYAFSKLKFPGRNIFYWFVISLLAMPTQLFIIPIYVSYSNLKLLNNNFSLALLYCVFSFSFGTFLMKSFYNGVPNEILESAKIDGANSFQIFLKIMLPLGKPAIISLGVINFFSYWNEFFMPLLFNHTEDSRLVTVAIAIFRRAQVEGQPMTNWPVIFTGMILSLIIPFIVYLIFQRRLQSGITVGAVKQ